MRTIDHLIDAAPAYILDSTETSMIVRKARFHRDDFACLNLPPP
jgi:hypothetical protein